METTRTEYWRIDVNGRPTLTYYLADSADAALARWNRRAFVLESEAGVATAVPTTFEAEEQRAREHQAMIDALDDEPEPEAEPVDANQLSMF